MKSYVKHILEQQLLNFSNRFECFMVLNVYNSIRFIQKLFHAKASLVSLFEVKMAASNSKGKNIRLNKKNPSLYFEANVDH